MIEKSASNARPNESGPQKFYEYECATCGDIGWVGGRRCECAVRRQIAERLSKLNRRYAKFAHLDLMNLTADPECHPKQADLIPLIQANPEISLVMFGGTGTGKTTIGLVLAKYAIEQGRPVVTITLSELLDQYRLQYGTPDRLPIVDADTLRESDRRYCLLIDEVDKTKPTEFAGERFFNLVNAASETQQQVIVASNRPKDALMAYWERAAYGGEAEYSIYGEPIIRRLCELPGAIEVNFF